VDSKTAHSVRQPRMLAWSLSLLVAAVAGAVILPVAVEAAADVITIVGPGSNKQSSGVRVVDGKLNVGDGKGPVTVDGKVNEAPAKTEFIGAFEGGGVFPTAKYSTLRIHLGGDASYTLTCIEGSVTYPIESGSTPARILLDVPCTKLQIAFQNVFIAAEAAVWGRP
jgi:hypothetical protein